MSQQSYSIQELTGQGGLGKSSLARWVFSQTSPEQCECFLLTLDAPVLKPGWLTKGIAEYLSGPAKKDETDRRHTARGLDQLKEEGRGMLVIVDSAEHLQHPECFSDLLFVHNLAFLSGTHFSALLAGRDPLGAVARAPGAIENKISMHWHLPPLRRRDTEQYLKWYCHQSKVRKNPFSPPSIDSLHKYSQGIPAVLNALAENCLIEAALKKTRVVHPEIVENMYRMSGRGTPPPAPPGREPLGQQSPEVRRSSTPAGSRREPPKTPSWDNEQSQEPEGQAEIGFSLFEEP